MVQMLEEWGRICQMRRCGHPPEGISWICASEGSKSYATFALVKFCFSEGMLFMITPLRHVLSSLLAISLVGCLAEGQQVRKQTGTAPSSSHIKIVAGIVGDGGTVRYLPRVKVQLMPKSYADAESAATNAYASGIDILRQSRDAKMRTLVEGRRDEIATAKENYELQLKKTIASLALDPLSVAPTCLSYDTILNKITGTCDDKYAFGQKVYLTQHLRRLFIHPAIIGSFDVRFFTKENTPVFRNRIGALTAVPLDIYQQVPEFSKQIQKAVEKERDRAKLKGNQAITPEVANAAVIRFVNDWDNAAVKSSGSVFGGNQLSKFGYISPEFFTMALTAIETGAKRTVKSATDVPLADFVAAKDRINRNYDLQQAQTDAVFRHGAEQAEKTRAAMLETSAKKSPPVQVTTTSLQGEAVLTVPAGSFTIFAEETTTDQHLRWSIPVPSKRQASQTIELTDANALKATPTTIASLAAQPSYPKATDLSPTDRAEYNLRYGSRLMKSWNSAATLHDAQAIGDELELSDTALGFGFQVQAVSTSVFNTLRMTDNDIASRFFKDVVAAYLQSLPEDLRSTGGSQTFEAVSIRLLGQKKSFLDKYAVGDSFLLTYTFRVADVESYANQKIDAQQLLDRGHIAHDKGRISIRLVSAQ
jgi:hypothetical protein